MRLTRYLVALQLAITALPASAGVQVHVSSAAEVARDPAHTKALSAELTRALANVQAPSGMTLDVSIVRLAAQRTSRDVEVQVEARAFLSDAKGRVQWASSARATARGSARDHALVQRDALAAVAEQLAGQVRKRR